MISFKSNPNFSFTEHCRLPYPLYEHDVMSVLDSVVLLFRHYFDIVDFHPLDVINIYPSENFPMTVYEKNSIFLCVSPLDGNGKAGCFWSQFVYQFSHEFCHYMSFGHTTQSMRWFEEVLCEMASHFFLIKTAEQWTNNPPYPHWAEFAPNFLSYEHISRKNVISFDLNGLTASTSDILSLLEKNEYLRAKNRYVALELLPLFIENPKLWNLVPHLHLLDSGESFSNNLQILGRKSEEDVSKILRLFGITDK